MDGNLAQQALNELLPYLEALDTQGAAIVQFLKDKGLTTDEEFAPYLEQAGNMTNIKWLAARVRLERLLSSLAKDEEKTEKKDAEKSTEKNGENTSGTDTEEPAASNAKLDPGTSNTGNAEKKTDENQNADTTPAGNSPAPEVKETEKDTSKAAAPKPAPDRGAQDNADIQKRK